MKKHYSWIFKVFLTLPVVFSFFCGPKNTPQKSTVTYEKNNVTYVENPALQNVAPPVYELKEILSIGDDGDDENYVFRSPRRLAVDDNGNIYVMDSRKFSVSAFDGKGVFSRRYGRRGEGPGEFLLMLDFAVDDHNRMLHILDLKHNKISRFLLDGTHHSEIRIDKYADGLFMPDGDTYYIIGEDIYENDKSFKNIKKYSRDGEKSVTSPKLPLDKYIVIEKGNRTITLPAAFCAKSIVALSPKGNLFRGMSDDYRFEVFNPVFQKVKIIKKDISERVNVTIEEKEQYIKAVKESTLRRGKDPSIIGASTVDLLPDYYPIYYTFWFDGDGRLWVPLIKREDQVQYIDIFDGEGVFVETRAIKKPAGTFMLYDVFIKPVIKGDLVYAIVRDAEENWVVKVYRLVLQPDAAHK